MSISQKSRLDQYRVFLEFVRTDGQRERSRTNRFMAGVFLWCFLVPMILSVATMLAVRSGWIAREYRWVWDWLILSFPVAYSLYFIAVQLGPELSSVFARGGLAPAIAQALRESEWRAGRAGELAATLQSSTAGGAIDWDWIRVGFVADLETMEYRARYLTALSGAIFFLIFRGIDFLAGDDAASASGGVVTQSVATVRNGVFNWIETSDGGWTSDALVVGLFLMLFYLSASQTHRQMRRYLVLLEKELR